ncbi:hypothetical protein OJAV_G00085050 [Oryzias javanicus]|uniref:Uncharacterized protein n=1 Tax=Oryzias javanicus TaxID=123683 RepID=A0A3S2UC43_ORYJA|nr:hypothetical protein OJAV_G00085050 [Oryzias javanicus]
MRPTNPSVQLKSHLKETSEETGAESRTAAPEQEASSKPKGAPLGVKRLALQPAALRLDAQLLLQRRLSRAVLLHPHRKALFFF